MIKVGIIGFGRIGRFVFRAAMERNDILHLLHSISSQPDFFQQITYLRQQNFFLRLVYWLAV